MISFLRTPFLRYFLFFFLAVWQVSFAQNPPPTIYQIPVQGKIVDDADSPIPGAVIQVYAGSKLVTTTTTGGDGKYTFQVPINADYIISISGPGTVTKKFMLGARGIPPERANEPFGTIEATVGLWKKVDGVDYSIMNQPANKYYYNPDKQKFEYDKSYLEQMMQLIAQVREKEKELEKKLKDADKNYQAAIKKGDAAFAKKDWNNAKAAYQEAGGLKPAENYPKTQIAAIEAALKAEADAKAKADADAKAKADAEAKAKAELDAKYAAAVKKGDDAFKAKDWATAKAGYNEALGVKPAEKYPKDQLAAVDKAIADEKAKADADAKAKAELEGKYAAALKKGDDAFAKKDWATAKAGYTDATGLKPAEKYPKDQLALVDKAIADEAAAKAKADADAKAKAELDAKYNAAVKKGDDAFKTKDWATAKAGYNEAHGIKKEEKYPTDQLAAIDKAIADEAAKAKADADAKAKAELDAKYNAAVKKGDDAFKAKDWATAKAGYNEAHGIKKEEKYPTDQLAAIDKAIADEASKAKADADAKAKAELDAKYAAAVKKGDDAFKSKDWATAKAGYNEAHGIKKEEKYPTDQLAAIDKAIADEAAKAKTDADAKAKAELDAKYAAAVKKGDDAFKTKDWPTAKAGYNEAHALKKTEKYPTDQLAAIDKAIADEAAAKAKADADTKAKADLEAKYAAAIKKGDDAFGKKDWALAKSGYTEALTLKAGEKYPKDQLVLVDKALADDAAAKAKADAAAKAKAELEAKYAAAIKKGDDAFTKKDWTNARVGYNEALGIKPGEKYPTDKLVAIDKAIEDEKSKLDAAAKAKAEAELKAKYDAAIKKGDAGFAKKDWTTAKAGYNEALGIKPGEKYPTDQLAAIDKAIADADAAAKAKAEADAKNKAAAEIEAKYQAAIKKGDDAFAKKDWINARSGYNGALEIKPGEKYPTDKLAAIDKAIEDEKNKLDANAKAKAEAELTAKYNAAVKRGDDAFKKKDWEGARGGYNDAISIKPGEKYPKDQLAAIDKAIADEKGKMDADAKAKAEAEVNARYAAAVKKGDDAFKKKDWINARGGYNEALTIKPAEKYPADQLAAIDKAIADDKSKMDADAKAKAEAELNAKYNAAVKKGDAAYAKKEWSNAKSAYTEALGIKPAEKYPKDQLAAIDKAIAAEKASATAASNEAGYKAAIVRGDNDMKMKKYKEAVNAYTDALSYKPNDAVAKQKLADAQKNLSSDETNPVEPKKKEPNPLTLKYPQGITEETKSEPGVYIVRRILVKGDEAWVYTMKRFNWGGVVFYKDDAVITQTTWDNETR